MIWIWLNDETVIRTSVLFSQTSPLPPHRVTLSSAPPGFPLLLNPLSLPAIVLSVSPMLKLPVFLSVNLPLLETKFLSVENKVIFCMLALQLNIILRSFTLYLIINMENEHIKVLMVNIQWPYPETSSISVECKPPTCREYGLHKTWRDVDILLWPWCDFHFDVWPWPY